MIHFVVSQPFDSYKRGDIIIDQNKMDDVRKSANIHNVVQVISHPEHRNGDFFRSDADIAARREAPVKITEAQKFEAALKQAEKSA